ncbi:MAG: ROK family protein [Candidatus Binatia bacterium]
MSLSAPALGLDVGGQSVKAVLVSAAGDVLATASRPTGEGTDSERLVDALASLRDEVTKGLAAPGEVTIGVGIAGVLDRSGTLRGAPHLPLLVGAGLARELSEGLGRSVVVHNDADCAAVAEGWGGAADGRDDYLMIAIGTGVGSGLVLGGRLRAGNSGFGCEFGHMMVVHEGRACGCGNRGCLEAYISETAAKKLVLEGPASLRAAVDERRAARGSGFAEAVFELGAGGNTKAEALATGMVDVLGAAIGSVVNVLDLTTVVLGGGVAPGVLARMDRLRNAAGASLFARPVADLDVVAAARGPLAGAIGAARLGMLAR